MFWDKFVHRFSRKIFLARCLRIDLNLLERLPTKNCLEFTFSSSILCCKTSAGNDPELGSERKILEGPACSFTIEGARRGRTEQTDAAAIWDLSAIRQGSMNNLTNPKSFGLHSYRSS
jgi:hypothetical protein